MTLLDVVTIDVTLGVWWFVAGTHRAQTEDMQDPDKSRRVLTVDIFNPLV